MRLLLAILLSLSCSATAQTFSRSIAYLGNANPRSSAANIPGIFVDSVAGSDSNAGTSNAPFASLAKVTATVGLSSTTNIYLKRGSLFLETWQTPTNATVDCYGSANYAPNIYRGATNSMPVITGAIRLTNSAFSLLAGKTNTYAINLTGLIAPCTNSYASIVTSNVLAVYENNTLLAGWTVNSSSYAYTTNSVDAGLGRFFFDVASRILYLSPTNVSNPATNGGFYEASIKTLLLHGGDNVTVRHIITEKSHAYNNTGGQGYGIFAFGSGLYQTCVARYGWNHNIGVANSYTAGPLVFDSCTAGGMELAGGSSFIAYKDSAGPSLVTFTNCYAFGTTPTKGTGFYTHDNGAPHNKILTTVINCVAYNMDAGFSDGYPCSTNWTGNTAAFCGTGYATGGGGAVVNYFTNYWPAYATARGISLSSGSTGVVMNCKIALTNESFNVFAVQALGTGELNITNTVISKNGAQSSSTLYCVGATIFNCWSNNFNNLSYTYRAGEAVPGAGDWNNYYNMGQLATDIAGADQTTVAQWKSARAPFDANCTTVNPSHDASFYTFTIVDPTGGDAN